MATVKKIIVEPGQTIWDIAMQEYGSMMGAKYIVKDNKLNGYTAALTPGNKIKIMQEPIDNDVVNYYRNNNITVVSKFNNDFNVPDFDEDDFN